MFELNIDKSDKEPFFDLFDVFKELDLKGKTLLESLFICVTRAQELYKNVSIDVNANRIPSFKYDGNELTRTTMSEQKIIDEIKKSLDGFYYDDAVSNLVCLINFYKRAYYRAKVYEPFVDYVYMLFERFNEVEELMKDHEKAVFEMVNMEKAIQELQKQNSEMKIKSDRLIGYTERYKTQFKKHFLSEKTLLFFLNLASVELKRDGATEITSIIIKLMFEGKNHINQLSEDLGKTKEEIMKIIKPFSHIIIVDDDGVMDLNYAQVDALSIRDSFTDRVKQLELETEEELKLTGGNKMEQKEIEYEPEDTEPREEPEEEPEEEG